MTRPFRVRLVLALVLVALGLPITAAAGPVGAAANQPVNQSRIDIVSQTPWVAPKGAFLLSADISGATKGSKLDITLHTQPLADRDSFSRSLFGVDLGKKIATVPAIPLDDVVPQSNGTQHVNVAISLTQGATGPGQIGLKLGLSGRGVYPLELALVDADGKVQTEVLTYLVRLPDVDDPATPLRAALMLDLHAPPTIGPTGASTVGPRTFDQVSTIANLAAAFPDLPLTLHPTPETIEALERTSDATRNILATVRGALAGRQLLDSPYVDLPFTSWVNVGMDDELNQQRARGNGVLTKQLTAPDSTTWAARPDLTTEAATKLWESGVRKVILPAHSFEPVPATDDEPTLARPFRISTPLASPLAAVAIDVRLQSAFERQSDPQLTAYQMLAELSMIEQEDPTQVRGVVLAAPTGWNPSAAFLRTLMDGLQHDPLVKAVTVDDLFTSVTPAGTGKDGSGPTAVQPLTPQAAPSLGDYPQNLDVVRDDIASYDGMVAGRAPNAQWNQRLLISGSTDLSTAERGAYLSNISSFISSQVDGIDVPPHQTVTLTAREGDIPLTLRSRLRTPVKVVLAFESNERLDFPHGNRIPAVLVPGTQQIKVAVRTRSPGDTPLTLRVVSPDGNLPLTNARITVRSTAVSGIGYVLSIGAALFLVVWWVATGAATDVSAEASGGAMPRP